jgi:hypothetical protein
MYNIQIDSLGGNSGAFHATNAIKRPSMSNATTTTGNTKRTATCAMWNQYVAFGFHQFDDCFAFAEKWTKAATSELPTRDSTKSSGMSIPPT